jgi:hypothetical protein
MKKSYNEQIAAILARELLHKSRKKWRTLNDEAQREIEMSESTNNMNVQNSELTPVTVTPVDRKTIEGSTPGDFRSQAAQPVMPPQPAPRAENSDSKGA